MAYACIPTAHLYADWGKGFETPTFSELSYRHDGISGLALYLKPARTRSGEVGLKLEPTPQSHLELALFRADSRNELASPPTSVAVTSSLAPDEPSCSASTCAGSLTTEPFDDLRIIVAKRQPPAHLHRSD